jgi:hypothetical protein
MFKCPQIAELLGWAYENKSTNIKVRHTADSKQWKHIDQTFPDFVVEPRNLQFGLPTNGVNPLSQMRSTWSTWPIMLINYNLPP